MELKLPGAVDEDGNKPLIQEVASTTFNDNNSRKKQPKLQEIVKPKFNWDTAERVDAQFQFMNQGELVFVNLNFKGYNKETDIRYALSENEILLEVRDETKNKVHRICKTLFSPINSQESTVMLLVDFIVFKLKKDEQHKKSWDDLGYDIKDFHIPESSNSYMRSNFLRQKSAQVGEVDRKDEKAGDNKENEDNNAAEEGVRKCTPGLKTEKDYHGDGTVEIKKAEQEPAEPEVEMTEEEKMAQAKKLEEELIQKMIDRSRTAK